MRVEIWSDVICPWCGIGQARLDAALAGFAHSEDVEVVHRAFQLDPAFPVGTTTPVRDMLRAKYRMSDADVRATAARVEGIAAADGLSPYRVTDNVVGNTQLAHELLAFAQERGVGHAAWKAMYRAYFGQGRAIFDVDALLAIAAEVGLPVDDAREALSSRRYRAQVEADAREAKALGATGVPFVVIDRRVGISGAQSVATFTAGLEKGWAERG